MMRLPSMGPSRVWRGAYLPRDLAGFDQVYLALIQGTADDEAVYERLAAGCDLSHMVYTRHAATDDDAKTRGAGEAHACLKGRTSSNAIAGDLCVEGDL